MRYIIAALFVVLALVLASGAHAQNVPDPRLDAAASSIAGHPVTVWCELDWASWLQMSQGQPDAQGFTRIGTPVVYVDPEVCVELHALLNGEDVGTYFAAEGLLTLAHESVHQRGITSESVADCTALTLVKSLAVKTFGIAAKVRQTYSVRVKRKGRFVRVRKHRLVTNPWLTRLYKDAVRWHKAKPAVYQGGC